MTSSNNKRVAKNAIALTLRTILTTIVGLYTSRIVLEALGVDNYGIYGVIGGVVGMASFLNAAMAGATSRFITFELGRGNHENLRKVFSTSLVVHIIIALIVAVFAETVGLWFVNNKMNFPEDSMFAVNVLYQFTILSMIVSFTQVPYTAAIIAHERMNIYAYFEIINVILKLGIVYLLLIISSNRLIVYAAMILAVSVISAIIYRMYCIRHFRETHFELVLYKPILKSMLKFSGFDMYGHMCAVFKNQLQPIFLNMFFGVIANAGSSIAFTVTGAISGLTTTIAQAFRPQIIKQYSTGDISPMALTMRRSVQFTLLAYAILALPIYFEADSVLYIWLGQVPEYSVEFLRLIIITALSNIVINTNNAAIHATGNIKNISFINGTLYLISPITAYILLKYIVNDAYIIYAVDIVCMMLVSILGLFFIRAQIKVFPIKQYVVSIIKTGIIIVFVFIFVCVLEPNIRKTIVHTSTLYRLYLIVIVGVIETILLITLSWLFLFDKKERSKLLSFLLHKFSK